MKAAPDFSTLDYDSFTFAPTGNGVREASTEAMTDEQIPIKSVYTAADLRGCETLNSVPGFAPFTRGPYPTMYVTKPWTVRQYAGFVTYIVG